MARIGEIEKLFYQDVREKKRIGSNIFKRKSTRRGGSNMSSMRVPTPKEQREWSGKVVTFNLNTIISIAEFEKLPLADQKLLMEHWRTVFKARDIIDGMGVNRNAYYKLVDRLDIKKAERRPKDKRDNPLYESPNIVSDKELHEEQLKHEQELVEIVGMGETRRLGVETIDVQPDVHNINVGMDVKEFSYSLKGNYTSAEIVRRLSLIINEIEMSNEKLNIEIKVSH